MINISRGIVDPLQPFDFGKSSGIYARFEEWTHTAFLDGVLYKSFEEDGAPHLLVITERHGQIEARLFRSASETTTGPGSALRSRSVSESYVKHEPSSAFAAADIASWILSSDLDLRPLYETDDPIFASLAKKLWGLKPPRTATVFEGLVIAIIEQQIGLKVAATLQNRLVFRLGPAVKFKDLEFRAFPSPERLAGLEPQDLRDLGLSMNKSRFILGIAEAVVSEDLDLESLKKMGTEEAREVLVSMKGVGRWTADYVLLRGLGRLEAVPIDDLGIRDAVGLFYRGGERATAREAEEILTRFGELAGAAAYYLLSARHREDL
jgi:DNA-3-methyladenine glycosylase II